MTQIPAGWYPDPAEQASAPYGAAAGLRWWDGTQWTAHSQPAEQAPPLTQPMHQSMTQPMNQQQTSQPPPYQQVYGQPSGQPGYAPTGPAPYGVRQPATTPDGQRLAGWWHRLGAFLLDGLILLVLSGLAAFPVTSRLFSAYGDFFGDTMRAIESGAEPPAQAELFADLGGPLFGYAVIALLVNFVYHVGFLKTLSATPGKLLTGLRVRLRDQPGPLSWGTVLRRWAAQNVGGVVGLLPVVGALGTLYALLDGLWPLWDQRKQALHDKVARTNVVRRSTPVDR
jgi:uncharacterized RDD family membrane protein YckC